MRPVGLPSVTPTPTPTATATPTPTPTATPTPTPTLTPTPTPSPTPVTLTVAIKGTGGGTVTAAPGTLTWSTDGKTGTASYALNTDVTITANPDAGLKAIWTGCDDNMGNTWGLRLPGSPATTSTETATAMPCGVTPLRQGLRRKRYAPGMAG
ncbi:MAG: hypothetical protein SFH39_12590 [Candidatus Magnetobacterium sp. LHC-1]